MLIISMLEVVSKDLQRKFILEKNLFPSSWKLRTFKDSHRFGAFISQYYLTLRWFLFFEYLTICQHFINFINLMFYQKKLKIDWLREWNRGVHWSRALCEPFDNCPHLCQERRKSSNCIVRDFQIPLATASRRQLTEQDWCRASRRFETGATIYRAVLTI